MRVGAWELVGVDEGGWWNATLTNKQLPFNGVKDLNGRMLGNIREEEKRKQYLRKSLERSDEVRMFDLNVG